ncbi:hypothetical protein FISHEDRAFT_75342 [Fistulina hepatica ATCC 64428]|uniref:Uncharacterized protein n=1 Tax=Fistulina hepatica ATCC 64428 TaxID=1128425 RepID=A0A0D7A9W4_9AGAR|nr:hypothetical protein FISHEDRAFT_75342 [Fistulina hepatica ATCC 64428]
MSLPNLAANRPSVENDDASRHTGPQQATGQGEKVGGMPTDDAPATKINTSPQQGFTQPGDGGDGTGSFGENVQVVQVPLQPQKVPFKDQVPPAPSQHAHSLLPQKTRGTVLRKPTLKDEGEKILRGEQSAFPDRH